MKISTKKMTSLAVLSAIAFIVMVMIKIPIVPALSFLKYEPKDIIITIGGFIFGPMSAFLISVTVSLVEMITVSDTGFIGLVMNILATCSFACTASYIYKKKRTMAGAVAGLALGCLAMTATMLLWNYLITPLYMKVTREVVVSMLLPAFLPFNLLKGGINAAITLLVYKPVVTALRKPKLIPENEKGKGKINAGVILVALVLLATCVLLILSLNGVI